MSKCEEIRELLWPLDGPREVLEGEAEARAHLEECAGCKAFFARDAALSQALVVDFATSAPERLRDRVSATLDGEAIVSPRDSMLRSRRLAPWMAAAAAMAIVALGVLRSTAPNLDEAYAEAFRTPHGHAAALDAPTAEQAYEFFMTEFGSPVVPALVSDGTVRGAKICTINGKPSAVVDYVLGGRVVAHYRRPASSPTSDDRVHSETVDGVCVVRWSDGEYDHALVAEIPEAELVVVAQQQFAALR